MTARIDKKKRLPMALILLGGLSLVFLLASSGMAFGGISAGSVALGLVLFLRCKNRGRSDARKMLCIFLLGITRPWGKPPALPGDSQSLTFSGI